MQTALTHSYNTAFAQARAGPRGVGPAADRRPTSGSAPATAGDPAAGLAQLAPATSRTQAALAQSSIGQCDVALTPLQVAMVASARRQQRRAHEAVPGPRGAGAGPDHADRTKPQQLSTRGQPAGRERADPDDAQRRAERHRPLGPDRRRRRGRQDRHGRERARARPRTPGSSASPTPEPSSRGVGPSSRTAATPAARPTGGEAAAPIAKNVMQAILAGAGEMVPRPGHAARRPLPAVTADRHRRHGRGVAGRRHVLDRDVAVKVLKPSTPATRCSSNGSAPRPAHGRAAAPRHRQRLRLRRGRAGGRRLPGHGARRRRAAVGHARPGRAGCRRRARWTSSRRPRWRCRRRTGRASCTAT